jgi:hypothetical protein
MSAGREDTPTAALTASSWCVASFEELERLAGAS